MFCFKVLDNATPVRSDHRMGSLDAQSFNSWPAMQNLSSQPFEVFSSSQNPPSSILDQNSCGTYYDYAHPASADPGVPFSNPFATGYSSEASIMQDVHPLPRYNPLPQINVGRPCSAPTRGYNPFAEDYEFSGSDPCISNQQYGQALTTNQFIDSFNYLQSRLCTPRSSHQYFLHHPLQSAVYPGHLPTHQGSHLSESTFLPKDALVPFNANHNGKSQRLLWLSEEEAEIIRLIRLSQMKENLRSSGLSLPEGQLSPVPTTESHGDVGQVNAKPPSNTPSRCSNISALSVEEFVLPASAETAHVMKEADLSLDKSASNRMDTSKVVDGDRQWIAIQRQKIKDIAARKQHNAAVRIQQSWRDYNQKMMPKKRIPSWEQCKIKDVRQDRPWYASVHEAAKVIQRVWCARIKRRKHQISKSLPETLKKLYGVIKLRHVARGLNPPTYVKFLRLVDRIHAVTEGARVRRRLKSRRLQAVIKEIKKILPRETNTVQVQEIRVLLEEMSKDTVAEPSADLLSQLSGQLQQKLIQLHTALQGPKDAARYLLRRCPATPIVIHGSRSTSPTSHVQRTAEQVHVRVIGNCHTENGVSSLRCSLFTVSSPAAPNETITASNNPLCSREARAQSSGYDAPSKESHLDKPIRKATGSQDALKRRDSQLSSSYAVRGKISTEGQSSGMGSARDTHHDSVEKDLQPLLQVGKSESDHVVASKQSLFPVTADDRINKPPYESGYESSRTALESNPDDTESQLDNRPKRPFLRRKSVAMAPQKLDWSKVKPMVSSRLEPGLKTKLYKSKVKESARNASLKKMNYSKVKSRLFNYETTSAVDTSGALSTDMSPETDSEGFARQGYAEIHTQVDMGSGEDCWRPPSGNLGGCPLDEVMPNFRYCEVNTGQDVRTEHSSPSARQTSRLPSYRYAKGRDSYADSHGQPGGSTLEEIDHNGEIEKKKQNHSFRYGGFKETTIAEASPSGREEAKADHIDERSLCNEASSASSELETSFKHVMSLKHESKMTLLNLFGSSHQGRTVIPRLVPDAPLFHGSFSEKRRLHELLIQEGRASKLQHDSLAFVSIRD